MINFYNQVPSIYTNASRDFQYLSWLINIVLNDVKHNVDDIYNLPNTKADPKLTELLAMTLGFKVKRKYDQRQLITLVSIIPSILKYKGSKKAIDLVCKALVTASGAIGDTSCELKDNCLEVLLPKEYVDTSLFMDLIPYILPAGITCRIIKQTRITPRIDDIKVQLDDALVAQWQKDVVYDSDTKTVSGLSGLFEGSKDKEPVFANYLENETLNAGLLSNSIIPVVTTSLKTQSQDEPDYITEENEFGTTVIINKYTEEANSYGTTTHIEGK